MKASPRRHASSRPLRTGLLAFALVALLIALGAPAGAAARQAAAPTISPARTSPGATVTIGARLATAAARPVELQRASAGRWVRGATGMTTKQGVYKFTVRAPAEPGRYAYRVVARRIFHQVGRRFTRLPALTTRARVLIVRPPPVSLSFPPPRSGPVASPDTGTRVTPAAEREALIQLFQATEGEHWTDNEGWEGSEEPCFWAGVFCNLDARVIALYLDGNNLSGEIPESLGDLTSLESLYLDRNQLSGPVPASLGRLESLTELSLDYNRLTGEIPASLGDLTKLELLWLSGNRLTGPIPATLGGLGNLANWTWTGTNWRARSPLRSAT
ncbi:MAG TPA: leucine-rich repeat domain-containing protein [Solirubrobacterales bacterium]|nr:leucine-rich repeat domain-containing protein [Solirubrobacterales bacterium]